MSHDIYENPLITRYASREMAGIWSAQTKHSTWRRLWLALAESEQELGLQITDSQLSEMRATVDDIDFDLAAKFELERRHDVMAHVETWGTQCPAAKPIIHLGATSCFVTDNSELLQIKDSLLVVRRRLVQVIDQLAKFAVEYRDLPCLGFTHLQAAQPTTVGKRATLWCWDLLLDLEELEYRINTIRFRGVKGTTGTQATFLSLFEGNHQQVEKLDQLVTQKMGFTARHAVTGQTYSRKFDSQVMATLNGIGQSCHKAGSDIRILQHKKELEEPFEKKQIGSSAMAYKRNPMRSERVCALARFAMSLQAGSDATMATQWMERTLDDSAIRRLAVPQAFLAIDACLILYRNITDGMVVYPKTIEKHLNEELPFMATEEILMAGVKAGGDRQDLHERIRVHSQASAAEVKQQGLPNDLISRLQSDDGFKGIDLAGALDAQKYIGRAPQQIDTFIAEQIEPVRRRYSDELDSDAEAVRV
ncbi:MAG: adenylosuccinate lyase [Fuerstiella sp.]|nr:adenylosuccinate lyase [Fuerstiella sp.]MCP4510036.1 adenylosuccinate lyase [Fuerstiella sp.]